MTRTEALRRKLKTYYSDTPCSEHKSAKRLTAQGACIECVVEQRFISNLWRSTRGKAYRRGVPFSLTMDQVRDMLAQSDTCPALGMHLEDNNKRGPCKSSPSIVCLYPTEGYVPGNVAIVSFAASTALQQVTNPQQLRKIADWMERALIEKFSLPNTNVEESETLPIILPTRKGGQHHGEETS